MYTGHETFYGQECREAAKRLFKLNVNHVELEPHSYCNRHCGYCPNHVGDRLGPLVSMEESVFSRILANLAEITFDGKLVLSHYCEPLADKGIIHRIRQIHDQLPHTTIIIYTNGDYLTADYLEDLAHAGVSSLMVSVHPEPDEPYSDTAILTAFSKLSVRIKRAAKFTELSPNKSMAASIDHPYLEIKVFQDDYQKNGSNRANTAQVEWSSGFAGRTHPCLQPFLYFVVGYHGDVVPCCQIRADLPANRPYVIGNIRDYSSIFELYASHSAAAWRRELACSGAKREPCHSCIMLFPYFGPEHALSLQQAWQQHAQTPPPGGGPH
ncbi:MAG: radical SAM/SPASM domain-containing protein [Magnetococcales bacterium]|nr:radical SAM/SPASM domain-containing protein [Magnetococcales bacterium]